MTGFTSLGLAAPILRALETEKYETPTPIQSQAIPHVLAGKDLLGVAQTGTGKTAAFALPILHRLAAEGGRVAPRSCRALVLAPTRELAAQIADSFRAYGRHLGFSVVCIVGGVSYGPQKQQLDRGADILVATPGRLLDHMGLHAVRLEATTHVVLDEADHMLDLGFIRPIRRILAKLPAARQTAMFSATMPPEIEALSRDMLRDPVKIEVTPQATTVEKIRQQLFLIEADRKRALLAELLADTAMQRSLVFTRTKRGADRVARHLDDAGIPAAAIHGNKSQAQRTRVLEMFRGGRLRVLVATDIAARGIDVDGISHVVNYELPNVPESYVHRIGRTARAGAEGVAYAFCAEDERIMLRDIERTTRQKIPTIDRRGGPVGGVAWSPLAADRNAADDGERAERRGPRGQRPAPNRAQHERNGERRGAAAHKSSKPAPQKAHGSRPPAGGERQGGAPSPQAPQGLRGATRKGARHRHRHRSQAA